MNELEIAVVVKNAHGQVDDELIGERTAEDAEQRAGENRLLKEHDRFAEEDAR